MFFENAGKPNKKEEIMKNKDFSFYKGLTKIFVIFALVFSVTLSLTGITKAEEKEQEFYVNGQWTSAYSSKEEAIRAGDLLNERIVEEGIVLLKNEDNYLPLKTNNGYRAKKVTLFGHNSVNPLSSDKREDMSSGVTNLKSNIYSSLKDAGYLTNPIMKDRYDGWIFDNELFSDYELNDTFIEAVGETEKDEVLVDSFKDYNDAAIIVLGSTGAPVTNDGKTLDSSALPEGTTSGHSLQLDNAQHKLLKYVNDNFNDVIVIINTSIPMELGFLEDKVNYPNIKASVLIGEPGANGFNALGRVLNGEVNPSGKLTDIYAKDMTKLPVWDNFKSYDEEAIYENPDDPMNGITSRPLNITGNQYLTEDGKDGRSAWFVDYKEGIYIGYRYFETRALTEDSSWYEENVMYPFGYGLSYTDFEWDIINKPMGTPNINEKSEITLKVKVTNKGTEAGKDVVQLYYTAPYTVGGIEKSHVVLADFGKTKLLQPGQSEVLTLKVKASEMASYDWNDVNKNDHKGYELEKGTYSLKLMKNSHEVVETVNYNVVNDIKITHSLTTGYKIENQFEYMNEEILKWEANDIKGVDFTRSDEFARMPSVRTIEEKIISDDFFENWILSVSKEKDDNSKWQATEIPKFSELETRPEKANIILSDLVGRDYNDPLWNQLLDQLTVEEVMNLINNGGFQSIEIPYIAKPFTFDTDGPHGWSGSGVGGNSMTRFATAPVIAATWNKELAEELGEIIGEQGLWGNSDTGVGIKQYTGWYAPAINTHRTPLDKRFKEYFSEDGVLAGYMAGFSAKGARSRGAYVTMKHFAVHEDGSIDYRGIMETGPATDAGKTAGLSQWLSEQALREIYLKPFQITAEIGDPMGVMTSFGRIGYTWAGANHSLLTEVLRNEWGYQGLVLTDIQIYTFMDADSMIRAGGDLILSAFGTQKVSAMAGDEATHLTALRNAAKNILYVVANSNAMQLPQGAGINYETEDIDTIILGNEVNIDLGFAEFNTVTKLNLHTMRYNISGGKLPQGLSLNNITGEITGIATESGNFEFEITVSAKDYNSISTSFMIAVENQGNTLNQVIVKYDSNGGNNLQNTILDKGGKLSQPTDPVREGYKFDGWYDNKELAGNKVTFDLTVDENITLYAKWIPVKANNALAITSLVLTIVAIAGVGIVGFFVFKKR